MHRRRASRRRRTRVDPCIKCTRSKLDTGQGVLGSVAPDDLLSAFCLVMPLVLSSVVLSPLVSSCLGFSALVSSCVVCWASPGPFLGLSRASLGTHFGPPRAILGLLAAPEAPGPLPGCSWAAPWPVLGDPGRTLGSLLVALGPLLARPWAAPGHSGAVLAASWASFGASWAALGRRKRFSRNPVKTVVVAWFLRGFGPSGPLLAALGWLLGRPKWSWAALGWLLGRPKWSWVALGPSEVVLGAFWVALASARRRRTSEGSEAPYAFIV